MITMHARPRWTDEHHGNSATIHSMVWTNSIHMCNTVILKPTCQIQEVEDLLYMFTVQLLTFTAFPRCVEILNQTGK